MIFITQGHQDSIAIEILLKSFERIESNYYDLFKVFIRRKDLVDNLKLIDISCSVVDDGIQMQNGVIPIHFIDENSQHTSSCLSLETALLNICPEKDILLTLPTSKDQLSFNGKKTAGYTEYLRNYFEDENIAMLFKSDKDNFLLITDHVPLHDVARRITTDLIVKKTLNTLKCYERYFNPIEEVYLTGINPHAGESGILGNEDLCVNKSIDLLKASCDKTVFLGPLSGDTLHSYRNPAKKQLFVYMFHDQGLPVFKERNGLVGLNISTGLPFLRMSVDHGTAFALKGKNIAGYDGCLYMLEQAIEIQKRL